MSICYVDTSALAKRYVREPNSGEAEAFLGEQSSLVITTLTTAEMRSLLARRRRGGDFDAALETQLYAAFRDDVRRGYLMEGELSRAMLEGSVHLIEQLPDVPLRTLDALHLAAAQELATELIATADAHMRDAAAELDIACRFFGA